MVADKNEALSLLEENLGEEIARKEEEFENDWKNFNSQKLEEQEGKLKAEYAEREARLASELKESRESAARAAAESAAALAAVRERGVAREAQLVAEAASEAEGAQARDRRPGGGPRGGEAGRVG